MNATEEMLAGYADPDFSHPDTDPDPTFLNTSYVISDAKLFIRIISLC